MTAMQQRKKKLSLKKSSTKRHSIKQLDAAIKANIVQSTCEKKLVNISHQSKPLKTRFNTDMTKQPFTFANKTPSFASTHHKIDQTRSVFHNTKTNPVM